MRVCVCVFTAVLLIVKLESHEVPQGQSPVPAQVLPPPVGTSSYEDDRYDSYTDEEAAGVN